MTVVHRRPPQSIAAFAYPNAAGGSAAGGGSLVASACAVMSTMATGPHSESPHSRPRSRAHSVAASARYRSARCRSATLNPEPYDGGILGVPSVTPGGLPCAHPAASRLSPVNGAKNRIGVSQRSSKCIPRPPSPTVLRSPWPHGGKADGLAGRRFRSAPDRPTAQAPFHGVTCTRTVGAPHARRLHDIGGLARGRRARLRRTIQDSPGAMCASWVALAHATCRAITFPFCPAHR